jgi:hypothetical protein
MESIITKRLSRDTSYKQEGQSYQSTLTTEDIKKKLENYVQVKTEDILKIPILTHIRYFSLNPKTGNREFRLGGIVTKFDPNGKYLVCSNGKLSWSVQLEGITIYKKLSNDELLQQTNEIIQKTQQEAMIENKKLERENRKLKKVLKEIKEHELKKEKKLKEKSTI